MCNRFDPGRIPPCVETNYNLQIFMWNMFFTVWTKIYHKCKLILNNQSQFGTFYSQKYHPQLQVMFEKLWFVRGPTDKFDPQKSYSKSILGHTDNLILHRKYGFV
ncbi:hypothetical protein QVD17_01667 [Tagetes erecta]|uniref:Uncharacterized protein n=1 Tax=Tagetes erecta TaxID=13708 RepID=A0AAD8LE23_TARER|nr:hypothetical protein QVD17_01667 [Tagetes erecta]